MEQIEPARRARQPGVVPPRVARKRRGFPGAAERARRQLDSIPPGERAEEAADVPGRSGAGLDERGNVYGCANQLEASL
jgi:hypothetical protein